MILKSPPASVCTKAYPKLSNVYHPREDTGIIMNTATRVLSIFLFFFSPQGFWAVSWNSFHHKESCPPDPRDQVPECWTGYFGTCVLVLETTQA